MIKADQHHVFSRISFPIFHCQPSLLVSHLDINQCQHRANEFFISQPILVCPCGGVHWLICFMCSSLLLPAVSCISCQSYLDNLWWEVRVWFRVGVQLSGFVQNNTQHPCVIPTKPFSPKSFVKIQVVQPYSSTNMATAWKNSKIVSIKI